MIWFSAVVPFSGSTSLPALIAMTRDAPGCGFCAAVLGVAAVSKTIDSARTQSKTTRARIRDSFTDRKGMLPDFDIRGKRQPIGGRLWSYPRLGRAALISTRRYSYN